ncbi:YfjL-like protein [Mesobacillus jeotgali]|uniref:YfjL-like protein n=1 Tax=Mesobacillus jeotgali TaxID=129985 RepID=UPI0009A75BF9|nr:hypothetical protein [Mesobacillus jeotgali]
MIRKILIVSVDILFICSILFFFKGNPISRAEAKKQAIEYLEKKYHGEEFALSNGGYYPVEGTYIIRYESKNKKVHGNLDIRKGKVLHEEKGASL